MTNKNDTLINPFGDKDYKATTKYQEQIDKSNPTLEEILESNKQTSDLSRLLMDSINTDYLD